MMGQPPPEQNTLFYEFYDVQHVGLESGPTSVWLWRELAKRGLPMICIDARHARAALSMQINKSDRKDAAGIARIMQTGRTFPSSLICKSDQTVLHEASVLVS